MTTEGKERDVRVKVGGGSSAGEILGLWVLVMLALATCDGPRRSMVRQAREIYDDARATWNAPRPEAGDTK